MTSGESAAHGMENRVPWVGPEGAWAGPDAVRGCVYTRGGAGGSGRRASRRARAQGLAGRAWLVVVQSAERAAAGVCRARCRTRTPSLLDRVLEALGRTEGRGEHGRSQAASHHCACLLLLLLHQPATLRAAPAPRAPTHPPERRVLAGGDGQRLARPGVAPHSCHALAARKAAKPFDHHLLACKGRQQRVGSFACQQRRGTRPACSSPLGEAPVTPGRRRRRRRARPLTPCAPHPPEATAPTIVSSSASTALAASSWLIAVAAATASITSFLDTYASLLPAAAANTRCERTSREGAARRPSPRPRMPASIRADIALGLHAPSCGAQDNWRIFRKKDDR